MVAVRFGRAGIDLDGAPQPRLGLLLLTPSSWLRPSNPSASKLSGAKAGTCPQMNCASVNRPPL
jgi:hypothetical protein